MVKITPVLPSCPKCSAPHARWLEFTSLTNKTNAFQCVACGHRWTEPPSTPASAGGGAAFVRKG
jgi:DNA-directed RNA polymerase subunit M/transcription elongation factor TFIIS